MPGVKTRLGKNRGIRSGSKSSRYLLRGNIGGGTSGSGNLYQNQIPRIPTVSRLSSLAIGGGVVSRLRAPSLPRLPSIPGIKQLGVSMPAIVYPRTGVVMFDRSVIRTNWNAIVRSPIQRHANYIRILARRSIRRRPFGVASAPGTPPHSHWAGRTPPFKQIFNIPYGRTGQIVGMVGYGGRPAVPGLHEYGGFARRTFANPSRITQFQPRGPNGQFLPWPAHIPTHVTRTVRYPRRPFMWPAFREARRQLPRIWSMTARGGGRIASGII